MASKKKVDRDKRLDALKKATDDWGKRETKRLKDEVIFLKSVIKGRTGSGKLANQNVSDSSKLLVDNIGQFVEG